MLSNDIQGVYVLSKDSIVTALGELLINQSVAIELDIVNIDSSIHSLNCVDDVSIIG